MNESTNHLAEGAKPGHSWPQECMRSARTSTDSPDTKEHHWQAPPIPPIPADEETWRRRSRQRRSYTIQGLDHDPARSIRPGSAHSFASGQTPATKRRSQSSALPYDRDLHANLHWEINALNPRNWRKRRKWYHTVVIACVTFTVTMASSVVALAQPTFMDYNDVSASIAVLPLGLFVLGLAIGSIIGPIVSERHGRKLVYTVCIPSFALFTLVAGFAQTPSGFFLVRTLAGFFAGPGIYVGARMLSDIWDLDEISTPLAFWSLASMGGPAVGMVLGGFIVEFVSLRWTQFVVLFACVICLPLIFTIRETSRKVILWRRHGPTAVIPSSPQSSSFTRPAELMLTRRSRLGGLGLSIYSACHFASIYVAVAAFPLAVLEGHIHSLGLQGLTFLVMVAGVLIGLFITTLVHLRIYKPRVAAWREGKVAEVDLGAVQNMQTQYNHRPPSRPQTARTNAMTDSRQDTRDSRFYNLAPSMHRGSTAANKSSTTLHQEDPEKNIRLSVAAANYLNGVPANQGRRILPERVLLILNQSGAFGDLCAALEAYQLRLDPVEFAKVLLDAVPAGGEAGADATEAKEGSGLAGSSSLHRNAAAATLNTPALKSQHTRPRKTILQPPPRWRLWLASPGSALTVASLFLIGWSSSPEVDYAVPILGMGILACGVSLTLVSTTWFLMDRHGSDDGPSALIASMTLRYLLSFIFVMLAAPMYQRLGPGWATSVVAFICAVTAVVPIVLVLRK